jgi:hypothetical protein
VRKIGKVARRERSFATLAMTSRPFLAVKVKWLGLLVCVTPLIHFVTQFRGGKSRNGRLDSWNAVQIWVIQHAVLLGPV